MKVKTYIILLLLMSNILSVQAVEIPSEIEFGGMHLKLSEAVRRKLKGDVERILSSKKGFQIKIERANLYFPIIERVFKEENLPDDFKFLSLQESALVSDAVSSSNAVGYWQFKKETAIEVGLRVDNAVDERMNIVASSRGAAKYLKKNNVLLNNWVYALLAYNTGLGGVKTHIEEKNIGARKMHVDNDMHWYVMTFLAHKLAYQEAVGKDFNPTLMLMVYDDCKGKSLSELSGETEITIENLQMYNKWLRIEKVPEDKIYFVVLPVTQTEKERLLANNYIKIKVENNEEVKQNSNEIKVKNKERKNKEVDYSLNHNDVSLITSVNGIRAITARAGDNSAKLASAAGISVYEFLRCNDLKNFNEVKPGESYYLQLKKNKALVFFHTVQEGEGLWDISQKYGIRIEAIRKKNRMGKKNNPPAGMVLWLRKKRDKNTPIEIKEVQNRVGIKKEIIGKNIPIIDSINQQNKNIIIEEEIDVIKGGEIFHEVKPGETLFSISKVYLVSIDSLKQWNDLETADIKLSQKLLVKKISLKGNSSLDEFIIHVIEPGETLYKISRKYEVTVQEIQEWNNKADLNVSIGEKLIIKRK